MNKDKLLYMKNLFINNKLNRLNYYITIDYDNIFEEEKAAYGIKIDKNNTEFYYLDNKFFTYKKAKEILYTLAKYKVTPIICNDVVEDLLKK